MKRNLKEWIALLLACAVLVGSLSLLSGLLTPKRDDFGSTWGRFLLEEENSIDVMFFGSSIAYCDVVPAVFWEHSGLTGYVNGGPEQTLAITLDYLRQSLKTQQPKAIFVECSGLYFKKYQKHTKTNIGQMPWGLPRLDATFRAAEPTVVEGLLFPLTFYHDRWDALTEEDRAPYEPDPLAGYTYLGEYDGRGPEKGKPVVPSEEDWENNFASLQKIVELCRKRGIALVLYHADTRQLPEECWQKVCDAFGENEDLRLLDCRECRAEIGAKDPEDYYDTCHYNAAGAEKFSRFLGAWAKENLPLSPTEDADDALWQERLDYFYDKLRTPMVPKETKE